MSGMIYPFISKKFIQLSITSQICHVLGYENDMKDFTSQKVICEIIFKGIDILGNH